MRGKQPAVEAPRGVRAGPVNGVNGVLSNRWQSAFHASCSIRLGARSRPLFVARSTQSSLHMPPCHRDDHNHMYQAVFPLRYAALSRSTKVTSMCPAEHDRLRHRRCARRGCSKNSDVVCMSPAHCAALCSNRFVFVPTRTHAAPTCLRCSHVYPYVPTCSAGMEEV